MNLLIRQNVQNGASWLSGQHKFKTHPKIGGGYRIRGGDQGWTGLFIVENLDVYFGAKNIIGNDFKWKELITTRSLC